MEYWFVDEEWLVKKGERYVLDTLPERPIHDLKCNDLQDLW
jgi:hypothetical protein